MSSDGHHISVMKGESRACWIVLAGILLTVRVCDAECIQHNFKNHITNHLLLDHWFQMQNFAPTGEEVKVQHEFLSVLNTICSSLIANKDFYKPTLSQDPLEESMQTRVMWIYVKMVKGLLKLKGDIKDKNDIERFCHNYTCTESYGTMYFNITRFENIYKKVCKWNGSIPECPFPQSTTAAVSYTSTPASEPGQLPSFAPPNGNASNQPIKSDDLNAKCQGASSGLTVSLVSNIILLILLILLGIVLYQYRCRSQRHVQAPDNQECMHLQNGNTEDMTQDQKNQESHKEDAV